MKTLRRSILHLGVLLPTLALWTGCDGSDVASGTLSGVVREAETLAPLAGVRVELGTDAITTGQDGRFAFQAMPAGATLTLRATAAGFDDYTEVLVVGAGSRTHDIALTRKTYYEYDSALGDFGIYLPPGVATYRGVVFWVAPPGNRVESDSRGFASGRPTTTEPIFNEFRAAVRGLLLPVVQGDGVALMGSHLAGNSTASVDNVLMALEALAEEAGHPELAQVPILLFGVDTGGCFAYDFVRRHSDRAIGFLIAEGNCFGYGDAGAARLLPGYFTAGELDDPLNVTQVFGENRSAGAPWALAVVPGAVSGVPEAPLIAHWMEAVLAARLPEGGVPGALRPIDETTGWLGNRASHAIAAYAAYTGDRSRAAWLPTMQTAQDWQTFVTP